MTRVPVATCWGHHYGVQLAPRVWQRRTTWWSTYIYPRALGHLGYRRHLLRVGLLCQSGPNDERWMRRHGIWP